MSVSDVNAAKTRLEGKSIGGHSFIGGRCVFCHVLEDVYESQGGQCEDDHKQEEQDVSENG